MLLMDSLGGSSKALMIACISPSDEYADETQSTLNYATRTMNIKNKPIIKMDAKEQIKFNLKREVELLRLQNNFLRQEYAKLTGVSYIEVPDVPELQRLVGGQVPQDPGLFPSIHDKRNRADVTQSFDAKNGALGMSGKKSSSGMKNGQSAYGMMQRDYNRDARGADELQQLEGQLGILRQENAQMRYQRELMNREFESMMYENNTLSSKLGNLEKVFIGESISSEINQDHSGEDSSTNKRYSHSLLVSENNELRARIEATEQDMIELKGVLIKLEADRGPLTGMTRDDSDDMSPRSMKHAMMQSEADRERQEQKKLKQVRKQQQVEEMLEGYPKPSSSSSKKSTNSSYMRFKKQMTGKQG